MHAAVARPTSTGSTAWEVKSLEPLKRLQREQAECTQLVTVLCATQLTRPASSPHLLLDLLMRRREHARAFLGPKYQAPHPHIS